MRSRLLPIATSLALLVAAPAAAAECFGLGAGLSAPTGTLAQQLDPSYEAGASFAHRLWGGLSLGVEGGLHLMGRNTTESLAGFPLQIEQSVRIAEGGPFVTLAAPGAAVIEPYLKAAIGTYALSFTLSAGSADNQTAQTHVLEQGGFAAGGGVRLRIDRRTSVGIEALYHTIQTSPEPIHMVTVSLGCYFGSGS